MENQLQFFSWLGLQIDSSNIDEWYNVSSRVLVEDNGGDELLKIYCGSLSLALASDYPDHEWLGLPWKFWNCTEAL